jgi:hypothetical protein
MTNLSIKNIIFSQDLTYNPCPEDCGGIVLLKDIISRSFNYVEQRCYLKICIGCNMGNGGRGRGVSCLPNTFGY